MAEEIRTRITEKMMRIDSEREKLAQEILEYRGRFHGLSSARKRMVTLLDDIEGQIDSAKDSIASREAELERYNAMERFAIEVTKDAD